MDSEPRRKKGDLKKSVFVTTVEELKTAIICRSLDANMGDVEIEPISAPTLAYMGISFCLVPPTELNLTTLQSSEDKQLDGYSVPSPMIPSFGCGPLLIV